MQYWLMKSEPNTFSIDDLKRKKVDAWDGVRNYQARNFMQEMEVEDRILFYHSGKEPAVVGIAGVAARAHPDVTQFDKRSSYFDAKATTDKPIWSCVDVRYISTFKKSVPLSLLKTDPALRGMKLLQKGSRLSVQPVSKEHFEHIAALGHE